MIMDKTAKHLRWTDQVTEQITPLLERRYFNAGQLTLARFLLRKGCVIAEHSHHNEQVANVLEGALKLIFPDKEVIARAGEVVAIPANVPHAAEALEDTQVLDIFTPPRSDWENKDDSYLRGKK
jgi:quercetin dioxygenase-like cupin family protein